MMHGLYAVLSVVSAPVATRALTICAHILWRVVLLKDSSQEMERAIAGPCAWGLVAGLHGLGQQTAWRRTTQLSCSDCRRCSVTTNRLTS